MYIVIDDTYGPEINTGSTYVTGKRRTNVAVIFSDADAQYVRDQVSDCLDEISEILSHTI